MATPHRSLTSLLNLIERLKVNLEWDESLPSSGAAVFDELNDTIRWRDSDIASDKDMARTLMLAHALGHWWSWEIEYGEYSEEEAPVVYGWRILCLVGADTWVTKDHWIFINEDNRQRVAHE